MPFHLHPVHSVAESALVLWIEIALFLYFLITNSVYIMTSLIAIVQMPWFVKLHRAEPIHYVYSPFDLPVSVLVPAFNEAEGILDTVASLLDQNYSEYEVVVVNDGSTDETLQLLIDRYALEPFPEAYRVRLATESITGIYQSMAHPNLRVIDKENGGKADALNAGVNSARYPLVFACDGDSHYTPDAIQCLAEAFVKNSETVLSSGAIGVSNDCEFKDGQIVRRRLSKRWIVRFQVLEYMRAFLSSRLGWAPLNALCIVSGACGLFNKEILIEAGGYRTDTIWEDMEITLRIHHLMRKTKRRYRISFTPFIVCWTRVPDTLEGLWKQRITWHRHVSECMTIHRGLFMSPATGTVGWLAFPYMVIGEWIAPFMVVFGVAFGVVAAYLGFLSYYSQVVLLGLVFALGLAICSAAILLDELSFNSYSVRDLLILLVASPLEFFGFRQFATLANFAGLLAWLVGAPIRGRKSVRGWNLPRYDPPGERADNRPKAFKRRWAVVAALSVLAIIAGGYFLQRDRAAAPNLAYFVPYDAVYRYADLRGPQQATGIPKVRMTSWKVYGGASPSRLAIFLTDPSADWLGLAHGLKAIGVPFIITPSLDEALKHRVIIGYPVVSGRVLDRRAFALIEEYVRTGGTFVGMNVRTRGPGGLFGFSNVVASRSRTTMNFSRRSPLASELREPEELHVRISDRVNPGLNLGSLGYQGLQQPAVATFNDGTAAIVEHNVGSGKAYAIGFDIGSLLLKGYNNRQEHIALHYVNAYEPALDVFLRTIRRLYVQAQPDALTLGTVPGNKRFSVIIAHDVDSAVSIKNLVAYARAAQQLGVSATFFIQTKYVKDYEDVAFYDDRAGAMSAKLEQMGMEVASHSVTHSRQFAKLPLGSGTEEYPDYVPFVSDLKHTYNATILGELRISKFILAHFTKNPIVSFRPGYLSNPFELPESAAETGYRFTSSTTADDSLTHLPFQLNAGRATTTEVPVFEIPITVEDQAKPRIDLRGGAAEKLSGKIARYGGVVSILIHPDIKDYKLAFERRYIRRYKREAYFGTYRSFGTWWAARDAVTIDTARSGSGLNVTLNAPQRIEGLPINLPRGMRLASTRPAGIVARTERGVLVLRGIQGRVHLRLVGARFRAPLAN